MRDKVIALIYVFLFSCCLSAEEVKLGEDEAIVIVKVKMQGSYTVTKSGTKFSLKFRRVGSKDQFSVKYTKKPQILTVKSGRYYFKTMELHQFAHEGLGFNSNPEPKYLNNTISIKAGTVTYIGNWIIGHNSLERRTEPGMGGIKSFGNFGIKTDYHGKTVLDVLPDNPWLKQYPLYVATDKGKTMELGWK